MKIESWRNDLKFNAALCRDTCHCEIYQSNIRDKRIPREAFSDLGDVKVENVIVTFYEEEDEHTLAEEGSQIERGVSQVHTPT